MNIKTTTRFGGNAGGKKDDPTVRHGFALTFAVEGLGEAVTAKLVAAGLEKVCNYGAASRVCKALGVEKNSLAEYSAERAEIVKATIEAFARNAAENGVGVIPLTVTVAEHVPGASAGDGAETNAKDRLAAWESGEEGLEAALAKRGYTGPTHTDNGEAFHPDAIAYVAALVRAAWRKKQEEIARMKAMAAESI